MTKITLLDIKNKNMNHEIVRVLVPELRNTTN